MLHYLDENGHSLIHKYTNSETLDNFVHLRNGEKPTKEKFILFPGKKMFFL